MSVSFWKHTSSLKIGSIAATYIYTYKDRDTTYTQSVYMMT